MVAVLARFACTKRQWGVSLAIADRPWPIGLAVKFTHMPCRTVHQILKRRKLS
jgi:hypothetical protein